MLKRARKALLNYIPTVVKTALLRKRPFLYSAFEIKPSSCTIILTDRCNLKCIMCRQWRNPASEELNTENWKKIISDLRKNGIRNIHLTGGEPFLCGDLIDLVHYSNKRGLTVGLTTNGTLMKKSDLNSLINAGLRSIAVSLDALNEAHDIIRGKQGSYTNVSKALIFIAEAKRDKKIHAYINFTLMKDTIKHLKDVKELGDRLGMPLAVCLLDKNSFLFRTEENRNEFWVCDEEDFSSLRDVLIFLNKEKLKNPSSLILNFSSLGFIEKYFNDPIQKDIPCASSQDRIIVDARGNLLGGCMSMGSFGNLNEKTFKELRQERRYKTAKKNMFYKACPGCSCGYEFNMRCVPQFILKDFFKTAYARRSRFINKEEKI